MIRQQLNRLIIAVILLCLAKAVLGQGVQDTVIVGPLDTAFTITVEYGSFSTLTDSTYSINFTHVGSTLGLAFNPTKIQPGYYLVDGARRRYRVISRDAADSGSGTLTVQELQDFNQAPSGVGLVYRAVDPNVDRIPIDVESSIGVSPAFAALIHIHNAVNGGSGSGGGGGSGLESVSTNTTLSGSGTPGDVLGVAVGGISGIHISGNSITLGMMTDGSVGTAEVVNGSLLAEDFAVGATDDADADPDNEAQTLVKVANQIILSNVGGTGGGSVTDEVNDADSDPANEYNTGINLNGNTLEITDGGGTQSQDLSSLAGNTNLSVTNNSSTVTVNSDTGTDALISAASAAGAGVMSVALWSKLNNIEDNATADQTGAEIVTEINTELGNTDWQTGGSGSGDISSVSDLTSNRVPYSDGAKSISTDEPVLVVDPGNRRLGVGTFGQLGTGDVRLRVGGGIQVDTGALIITTPGANQTILSLRNLSGTEVFGIRTPGTPADAEFNLKTNAGDLRLLLRATAGLRMWYNNTSQSVSIPQNHFADAYFGAQSFAFNNPFSSEGSNLYDRAPADWFAINNYKSYTWPRGTTAQRPTSEIGRGRYNTSTNTFELADDVGWEEIAYKSEILTPAFGECFTSGGFVTYDLSSTQVVTGLNAGNLENFTHSAGVLTFNGTGSGEFLVSYNLSLSDIDTNADEVIVRIRVNNSVLINAGGECRTMVETSSGVARTANCAGFAIVDLASGEDVRLELSSGGSPTVEVKAGTLTVTRKN